MKMSKLKILVFVSYYLPGYKSGGALRTIQNMVSRLSDDFEFLIITRDRDFGDIESYPDLSLNNWNSVANSQVFYASSRILNLSKMIKLFNNTHYDILYLNSFFDPFFSVLPLLIWRFRLVSRRPCLIAPRGEFSKGAISLKALQKNIYIYIAKAIKLYSDVHWHASSVYEAEDIRRVFNDSDISINLAQDLTSIHVAPIPTSVKLRVSESKPLRIIFLSRICRKKNLDFLLKVLRTVSQPVVLDVYGPIEDEGYWSFCQRLIKYLPSYIQIAYYGHVKPEQVHDLFASYDLFAFPTRGENFGHVIIESLRAGTPVLVSDQTPWRSNKEQALQEISLLDLDAWAAAIDQWANLDASNLSQRRAASIAYANRVLHDENIIDQNRNLFLGLIDGGSIACAE